jgi:hypothetical protein
MRVIVAIAFLFLLVAPGVSWAAEGCPERPNCSGCGCKGGPGYRVDSTGRCVAFADLERFCGVDPDAIGQESSSCTFENAPNTGANRWCAFGQGDPD